MQFPCGKSNTTMWIHRLFLLLLPCVAGQDLCWDVPECYCYNTGEEVRADCTGNTVIHVPEDLPRNTTEISISSSMIQQLESGNLSVYSSLVFLGLTQNTLLTTIAVGAFDGVGLLQEIRLDNNRISEIELGTFAGLPQLRELVMNNNILSAIPPLSDLTSLVTVSLEGNRISEIPANAFGANTGLKTITLSYNEITSVAVNAFNQLSGLDDLFLDNNNINSLPQGSFNGLTSLTQLYINSNQLTELTDTTFIGLGSQLQLVTLAYNNLAIIQDNTFAGVTGLVYLDLNHNRLTSVPSAAIKKINSLRDINLSGNLLSTVEDYAFSNMASLRAIYLAMMDSLTDISVNAFSGITNLTQLSLYGNPLLTSLTPEHLPDSEHAALLSLQLYDNGFTSLQEEIFSNKASLERVDLFGNPFLCDCQLKWMPRVVLDDIIWARHWSQGSPILCGSPGHLLAFEIPRMRDLDFTCREPQIELTMDPVVAYLHGNATLQVYGHHGIPETWWVTPAGDFYHPLRTPPQLLNAISQTITVTEDYQKTATENIIISTLEFSNVTAADAGVYNVWAANHVDNVTSQVQLEVLPYELTPVPWSTTEITAGAPRGVSVALWLVLSVVTLNWLLLYLT